MTPSLLRVLLLLSLFSIACTRPLSVGAKAPAAVAAIWLGGDVHLGDGPTAIFGPPPPSILGAIGLIDLEGPVRAGPSPLRLSLHNAPAMLPALSAAGVRAVGVANNHAQDSGDDGERATVQALRAVGLLPFGGSAGPARLQVGPLRVAVTAHDLGEAGPEPGAMETDLAQAKSGSDLLISTFHTRGPPSYLAGPALRAAVEAALRAGALVVAAHGSHSIGKIERHGAAIVAWGLGNLRFRCDCTDERDGIVLWLELGRRGVLRAAAVPIAAGLGDEATRPAPEPGAILDLLESLGTKLRREGALGWL